MSSPKPTLTIASVGVSPIPINVTIFSEETPIFRTNGGDLRPGDRWMNTELKVESIYYDGEWITVTVSSTPGQPIPEGDNKDITVEIRDTDDGGGGNLIWKPEDDLLIFEEADMDSRIPTDITSLPLLTKP